jgi:hypothetical protein
MSNNNPSPTQAKGDSRIAANGNAPAPQVQAPQPQPQTAPLSVTPAMFPEMPYSANVRAVDADGFEWQFTVRGVNETPFMTRVGNLKATLLKGGYKPATPRSAQPHPQATAGPETEPAPLCAIHKTQMKKRSKDGRSWWSCTEKLDDGQWCQYRPRGK